MFSLYMFARWYTALAEVALIAAFCYWAVKRHEKYHRAEKYDDRRFKEVNG